MSFLLVLLAPVVIVLVYGIFVFSLLGLAALTMWVLDRDMFL